MVLKGEKRLFRSDKVKDSSRFAVQAVQTNSAAAFYRVLSLGRERPNAVPSYTMRSIILENK